MTKQERETVLWYLNHYKYIMDEITDFEVTPSGVTSHLGNPTESAIIHKYADERINNYCKWEKAIELTREKMKRYNEYAVMLELLINQEKPLHYVIGLWPHMPVTAKKRIVDILQYACNMAKNQGAEFNTHEVEK